MDDVRTIVTGDGNICMFLWCSS